MTMADSVEALGEDLRTSVKSLGAKEKARKKKSLKFSSSSHYTLVHRFIPVPQATKIPDAEATVKKERRKLKKVPAWQMTKGTKRGHQRGTERTTLLRHGTKTQLLPKNYRGRWTMCGPRACPPGVKDCWKIEITMIAVRYSWIIHWFRCIPGTIRIEKTELYHKL